MKKFFTVLLCLLLVCSFMACGKDNATTDGAETTAATAAETVPVESIAAEGNDRLEATITFGHDLTDAQIDAVNHRLETFYARFPGVKVVFREMNGEVTPENAPTIMLCTPDQIPGYLEKDMLMPLDGWIDTRNGLVLYADGNMGSFGLTTTEKDDLIPIYTQEGKQFGDETTWSLPFMRHALVLYYNGTFFSENDLGRSFISWDEVFEACREIKALDPDSVPLAIADLDELFISLCAQSDIPYNADEWQSVFGDEAMEIVKELNKLYQEGCLTVADENTDLAEKEGTPRNYMVLGSTARAESLIPKKDGDAYAYEVLTMALPRFSEENPRVLTYGKDLAVFAVEDDDILNAAWMLVKYMCADPAFQGGLAADIGFLPVLMSPANPGSGEYSDYLDSADESVGLPAMAALTSQDQDRNFFTAPAFTGSAQIREQLDALIRQCLTFTGDADTQIAEAFENALAACTQ